MATAASISLRISDAEKTLIDQAAQSMGKSRTAFIRENTLRAAGEVILDRNRFSLDSDQWARLHTVLDNPPSEDQIHRLHTLLTAMAPWQSR